MYTQGYMRRDWTEGPRHPLGGYIYSSGYRCFISNLINDIRKVYPDWSLSDINKFIEMNVRFK